MNNYNSLTKNFSFISDININETNKDFLIKEISDIEKFGNVNSCITKIGTSLEFVLNLYLSNLVNTNDKLFIDFKNSNLYDKITTLSDIYGSKFSKQLLSSMHSIRSKRNVTSHCNLDNITFDLLDVITELKNLWIIITNLLLEKDQINLIEKFDWTIYSKITDLPVVNISPTYNRLEKIDDEISPDLTITGEPLILWLTLINTRIIIPIYQRKYEWKEEQIAILYNDICNLTKNDNSHYFGTIAVKLKQKTKPNELDNIKIIDGQQRITTSIILLCAAKEVLKNKFNIDIKDEYALNDNIYKKDWASYIYNPGGDEESNKTFKSILEGKFDISNQYNKNKFASNYIFLYEKMMMNFEKVDDIRNFLLTFVNKFKVGSILFDPNKHTNKKEMEIFQNLNSKGLDLGLGDLIKNYIFSLCSDELLSNAEKEIPLAYINLLSSNGLFEEGNSLEEFYVSLAELFTGKELPKGKNARFNLICITLEKLFKICINENEISTLVKYKKYIDFIGKFMKIYSEVSRVIYTKNYIDILKVDNILSIISQPKKLKLFIHFSYVTLLAIEKFYHWELDLNFRTKFKLERNNILEIKMLYLEICKFIIRTTVITRQGDSSVLRTMIKKANQIFISIESITSIKDFVTRSIEAIKSIYHENYTYDKFKLELQNNAKHNGIVDLLVLTEHVMNDSLLEDGEIIKRKSISIEHIMPREIKSWLIEIDDIEQRNNFKDKYNNYLEKIGNYLILTNTKNSQASNYPFLKKKSAVYGKLSSPLYNSNDKDIDVSNKYEWTFQNIEDRTIALIEYILKNVITEL